MKVAKSLLLGSAAVLATVAGAQAADLPTRKAAPVQYVKICDAYGAGFFYIPGTDTCLRVGGLVLADWQVSNAPARYVLPSGGVSFAGANALGSPAWVAGGGSVPGYIPSKGRDAVSSLALGRLELDARTQSPWGTVRAFMRVDSTFGSAAVSNTGGAPAAVLLGTSIGTAVGTGYASKEATYLNKAFLQFAGITMGRIQSMFDFYADAVGYTAQVGSNQTVNAIAYTATFGGGFSATLSVEDEVSHRGPSASVITGFPGTGLAAPIVQFNGTRMPDVVANIRVDQPWGAAQLSGAIHSNNRSLWQTAAFAPGGIPVTTPTWSSNSTNGIGFAIQGGLKFNLNMLAPGDVLWLQATFAKGAIGYANGSNFAFVNGIDYSLNYGVGLARMSSGNGWAGGVDNDCVWTWSGSCEQSNALAVVAAMRHYWTPTISSTLSASYYSVWYSQNATNPALGAFAAGSTTFGTGLTNYRQTILATGLEWNPIKNFGIGGEIAWTHGVVSRPQGMAQDLYLAAYGMSFKSNNDLIRGRVRMYRAF